MADKVVEKEDPHIGVEHDEDNLKADVHNRQTAQAANAVERETTLKQAIRENWKAMMWSAIISLTIVMEGYDQRYASSQFLII